MYSIEYGSIFSVAPNIKSNGFINIYPNKTINTLITEITKTAFPAT